MKPKIEYRTVTVTPTDPVGPAEIQQQAIIVWDKINNASVISDRDEISIVYTADTRKELLAFLSTLGRTLAS